MRVMFRELNSACTAYAYLEVELARWSTTNRTDDITHDAFRIGLFKERVCSHSKSLRQSATLRNALNFRLEMG